MPLLGIKSNQELFNTLLAKAVTEKNTAPTSVRPAQSTTAKGPVNPMQVLNPKALTGTPALIKAVNSVTGSKHDPYVPIAQQPAAQPKATVQAKAPASVATPVAAAPAPTAAQPAPTSAPMTAYDRLAQLAEMYPISQPNYLPVDAPAMRSGADMAALLGVVHDRKEIEKTMREAAEKKFANLDVEYGRTQDLFYDAVAKNADMLMGALRRGDRDAVMSGTTKGSNQAQQLSAMLGISADNAKGATELAQGRSDLVNQRETEMAQIAEKALKQYNDLGINLGQVGTSELNANMVGYTGAMNHNASINAANMAANAAALQALAGASAGMYGADMGLLGAQSHADSVVRAAQANASGQLGAARISASAYQQPQIDPVNQQIANLMAMINSGQYKGDALDAIRNQLLQLTNVKVPVTAKNTAVLNNLHPSINWGY